ncbi:hypothetical protein [Glutamicibacter sp. TV12E]|uniref:hypothetical protein n=1 Tax=Glutamicibacter sp. TV12E TaxID=3446362 RepID=UPI0040336AF8
MILLLDRFRFTATLISGGGRDIYGEPQPTTETPLEGCLLVPAPRTEEELFSDVTETRATLYFNHDAKVSKKDRIRTPEGSPISGTWAVDADVVYYPLVTEVQLRKES